LKAVRVPRGKPCVNTEKIGSATLKRMARRTIMCMLLIAALAIICNLLGP